MEIYREHLKKVTLYAAFAALVSILSGCGGGGDDGPQTSGEGDSTDTGYDFVVVPDKTSVEPFGTINMDFQGVDTFTEGNEYFVTIQETSTAEGYTVPAFINMEGQVVFAAPVGPYNADTGSFETNTSGSAVALTAVAWFWTNNDFTFYSQEFSFTVSAMPELTEPPGFWSQVLQRVSDKMSNQENYTAYLSEDEVKGGVLELTDQMAFLFLKSLLGTDPRDVVTYSSPSGPPQYSVPMTVDAMATDLISEFEADIEQMARNMADRAREIGSKIADVGAVAGTAGAIAGVVLGAPQIAAVGAAVGAYCLFTGSSFGTVTGYSFDLAGDWSDGIVTEQESTETFQKTAQYYYDNAISKSFAYAAGNYVRDLVTTSYDSIGASIFKEEASYGAMNYLADRVDDGFLAAQEAYNRLGGKTDWGVIDQGEADSNEPLVCPPYPGNGPGIGECLQCINGQWVDKCN